MARIRRNFKDIVDPPNTAARKAYRDRKKANRKRVVEARGTQVDPRQQLWNRKCNQDRRWLRYKVESKDRGGIPYDAEQQLIKLSKAPTELEQRPKLRDGVMLSDEARNAWLLLKQERKEAMEEQGRDDYVKDWWLGSEKTGVTGRGKKMKDDAKELGSLLGRFEFRDEADDGEGRAGEDKGTEEDAEEGLEQMEEKEEEEEEEEEYRGTRRGGGTVALGPVEMDEDEL